ncbi:kinase-like domain-containing protein [Ephemerocybe angulata]|uniref:Kinase-like domain-containing protein n=1 Tax=Ephemerocybe angulata TaxID=980116 RepID=A0A8H6I968_9AGAR|nr:kinase-like domain-containing protein [Tulosesus angulatus]
MNLTLYAELCEVVGLSAGARGIRLESALFSRMPGASTSRCPSTHFWNVRRAFGVSLRCSRTRTTANKPKDSARRAFNFESNEFHNRTMSRVTMACYGSSLDQFTSQRQAIAAIRDAIQGHWNLLKAGIMHRDVSMDNILFGEDDSDDDPRGVLIDLDMAMVVDGPTAGMLTEYRVGTHLYQSVSVLRNSDGGTTIAPVPRDYLDDLESFLYVLCHLLFGFKGVNLPVPEAFGDMAILAQWEQVRLSAAHAKANFIGDDELDARRIPPFWSSACVELCDKFRKFASPISKTKNRIRNWADPKTRQELSQNLHNEIENHYAYVISIFDDALSSLNSVGGDAPRVVPPSPGPSFTYSSSSSTETGSRKRSSSGSEDGDSPPVKRRRSDDSDSASNTST